VATYSETTGRGHVDGVQGNVLLDFVFLPSSPSLAHIKHLTVCSFSDGNHVFSATDISMDRMGRRLEGEVKHLEGDIEDDFL
jgi:hypothetical protein